MGGSIEMQGRPGLRIGDRSIDRAVIRRSGPRSLAPPPGPPPRSRAAVGGERRACRFRLLVDRGKLTSAPSSSSARLFHSVDRGGCHAHAHCIDRMARPAADAGVACAPPLAGPCRSSLSESSPRACRVLCLMLYVPPQPDRPGTQTGRRGRTPSNQPSSIDRFNK